MQGVKKIKVEELRLGMYLVRFEGAWLASPFWTSRFLIDSPDDLRTARASGLRECWIDTTLGCNVADEAVLPTEAASAATVWPAAMQQSPVRPVATATSVSFTEELQNASRLCKTARQSIVAMFSQARIGKAVDMAVCTSLVHEIVCSVERHPGALISLSRLKADDDYTYMHSVAVCALMVALAQSMKQSVAEVQQAGLGGLLHDIGKARIPIEILNKPSSLSDEEFSTVKQHPQHGYDALQGGAASEHVRQICLHHHERMDGRGYPHGQAGEQIPLMARMAAVCDVYDAVTSNRPYKTGWDPADALAKMISWKGHFDPTVLAAFIDVVGIYPTGSLVRLKSGRLAVVVEQNKAILTKPVIKVFYSASERRALEPELVDLSRDADDAITGIEERDRWPAPDIEKLWAGTLGH